jgi:hypothetical protein
MFARCSVRGLLLLCLGSSLVGCGNPTGLDSVRVTPAAQSLTVGQTAQFTAIGTFGNASRPSTQNLTSAVTWTSSVPSVATISATGMATAVSAGSTVITASTTGYAGPVSSTANFTVTGSTGGTSGGSGGSILSLTIILGHGAYSLTNQIPQHQHPPRGAGGCNRTRRGSQCIRSKCRQRRRHHHRGSNRQQWVDSHCYGRGRLPFGFT